MKKVIKIVLIIIIIAFVVIQFFRPERTTTEVYEESHITKIMNVPDDVHRILKRSCFDCHSDHTAWPWYTNVAPASWLVAKDVRNGRTKMNFSQWGKIPDAKREARLEAICEEITEGEMPLKEYLYLHGDAKLTPQDKDVLCNWVKAELKKIEDDVEMDDKEKKEDKGKK
ncbi:MAG TPA: heme-binding domain-containing protein [Ignavibacteria bacterium]|nr:heme-binding domain-containing protein [Ignavibacteria bacterium]